MLVGLAGSAMRTACGSQRFFRNGPRGGTRYERLTIVECDEMPASFPCGEQKLICLHEVWRQKWRRLRLHLWFTAQEITPPRISSHAPLVTSTKWWGMTEYLFNCRESSVCPRKNHILADLREQRTRRSSPHRAVPQRTDVDCTVVRKGLASHPRFPAPIPHPGRAVMASSPEQDTAGFETVVQNTRWVCDLIFNDQASRRTGIPSSTCR